MNRAEAERDARIAKLTDRELLGRLLRDEELEPHERSAFEQMAMASGWCDGRDGRLLTARQRAWCEQVLRRLTPIRAADAPRGREVPTPEVLRNLPKRPPGRP